MFTHYDHASNFSCNANLEIYILKKKTYGRLRILVLDFEKLHGTNHSLHGHKYVLKDQLDESSLILIRITGSVDNAHLFNEGRFPGFSRTCIIRKKIML